MFSPTKNGNEAVPSTSAFSLSPESSYGKKMSVSIHFNSTINLLAVADEELYFSFPPSEDTSTVPSPDALQPEG